MPSPPQLPCVCLCKRTATAHNAGANLVAAFIGKVGEESNDKYWWKRFGQGVDTKECGVGKASEADPLPQGQYCSSKAFCNGIVVPLISDSPGIFFSHSLPTTFNPKPPKALNIIN